MTIKKKKKIENEKSFDTPQLAFHINQLWYIIHPPFLLTLIYKLLLQKLDFHWFFFYKFPLQ